MAQSKYSGETPLFTRLFDFSKWLVQRAEKYPKAQRFILASRLLDTTFALHAKLVEARKMPQAQRCVLLVEADVLLEQVRMLMRLSLETRCLDLRGYEHGSRLLNEVGRQHVKLASRRKRLASASYLLCSGWIY